jgi:DNA-binding beta-propeller fold protein YncE
MCSNWESIFLFVNAWYITFHGGGGRQDLNNIHVFSETGRELGKALDRSTLPSNVELRELRGFDFGPDGDLYVANAYQDYSQVLRFAGTPNADGRHEFRQVFVQGDKQTNPALDHPFSIAFDGSGDLYVSSQDSNVVARFFGPNREPALRGTPMALPSGIQTVAGLPPGTFVPPARHFPDGVETVRDALIGPEGHLYVADRDADCVRVYDGQSGAYLKAITSDHLSKPIHLLFTPDQKNLLIGSCGNDAVLRYDLERLSMDVLVPSRTGGLEAPSGLAFGPEGRLYVACRTKNRILRFDPGTGKPDPAAFITDLADNPEFIRLVPVQTRTST